MSTKHSKPESTLQASRRGWVSFAVLGFSVLWSKLVFKGIDIWGTCKSQKCSTTDRDPNSLINQDKINMERELPTEHEVSISGPIAPSSNLTHPIVGLGSGRPNATFVLCCVRFICSRDNIFTRWCLSLFGLYAAPIFVLWIWNISFMLF